MKKNKKEKEEKLPKAKKTKKLKKVEKDKVKKTKIKKESVMNTPSFNLIEVIVIVLITAIAVSLASGILIYKNYVENTNLSNDKYIEEFKTTFNNIVEDYVDTIDKEELIDSAIEGMFSVIDDPYSDYLNKEATDKLSIRLDGQYNGIGIEIRDNEANQVEIVSIIENSPAEGSELKPGDILTSLNGVSLKDKDASYVSSTILDKNIDKVIIEYKRSDITSKVTIKKSTIITPTVFQEKYDNVGYLQISTFSQNAYADFKNKLEELEKQGIESLIIDLRNNTGGYLNTAYEIADLFIKKDKVIYKLNSKGAITSYKAVNKEKRNYKIAVLINKSSASASEVLALALKESYGATLVGEQSYGKGTVQQTEKLKNGDMIKYTTALWLGPKGTSINGIGITPDIPVLSNSSETDNQLEEAIKVVK